MDLDDAAATNFYYALKENTTLETFDISDPPGVTRIGPKGVTQISEAVRSHPALVEFKVDGAALPVQQVRGKNKTDSRIEADNWGLRRL